jgi:hypothetical protein
VRQKLIYTFGDFRDVLTSHQYASVKCHINVSALRTETKIETDRLLQNGIDRFQYETIRNTRGSTK